MGAQISTQRPILIYQETLGPNNEITQKRTLLNLDIKGAAQPVNLQSLITTFVVFFF